MYLYLLFWLTTGTLEEDGLPGRFWLLAWRISRVCTFRSRLSEGDTALSTEGCLLGEVRGRVLNLFVLSFESPSGIECFPPLDTSTLEVLVRCVLLALDIKGAFELDVVLWGAFWGVGRFLSCTSCDLDLLISSSPTFLSNRALVLRKGWVKCVFLVNYINSRIRFLIID